MILLAARTAGLAFVIATLAGAASAQVSTQIQPSTDKPPAASSSQSGPNMGKHDTNAPINVASDNFIGNFETKEGTYIGNVLVVQADYHLRSDTLKVMMLNGQPNKFYADGKVVFQSEKGIATGDHGIYDLNPPRTLTMTGNVVLTKQKDVMRGTQLVVNLVTGDSHMTAHGMPGNRVQSLFIPKPQPQKPGEKPSQTPQN